MNSYNENIEHHFQRKWIPEFPDFSLSKVVTVMNQAMYESFAYHDPKTMYVIYDTDNLYLGDQLIPKMKNGRKYMLTYCDHRKIYSIYTHIIINGKERLIPIADYEDPNVALRVLKEYNMLGYHGIAAPKIYSMIQYYMDDIYGIHEVIMGIISISGFKDDQRLQHVNELARVNGVDNKCKDLTPIFKESLTYLKNKEPIFKLYSDIYDIFLKYDFFKSNNVKVDDIIKDIMICIGEFIY